MTMRRVSGITAVAVVLAAIGYVAYAQDEGPASEFEFLTHDPLTLAYEEHCSVCHGENMEGTGQGTPLVGIDSTTTASRTWPNPTARSTGCTTTVACPRTIPSSTSPARDRRPGHTGTGARRGWSATELYRVEVDGGRVVARETLIEDLARIRDVEVGVDGLVYLLLEHASGGRIVRLVPAG